MAAKQRLLFNVLYRHAPRVFHRLHHQHRHHHHSRRNNSAAAWASSPWVRGLLAFSLALLHIGALYFLISKAAVRGFAWQRSFFRAVVSEWLSDFLVVQVGEIAIIDFWLVRTYLASEMARAMRQVVRAGTAASEGIRAVDRARERERVQGTLPLPSTWVYSQAGFTAMGMLKDVEGEAAVTAAAAHTAVPPEVPYLLQHLSSSMGSITVEAATTTTTPRRKRRTLFDRGLERALCWFMRPSSASSTKRSRWWSWGWGDAHDVGSVAVEEDAFFFHQMVSPAFQRTLPMVVTLFMTFVIASVAYLWLLVLQPSKQEDDSLSLWRTLLWCVIGGLLAGWVGRYLVYDGYRHLSAQRRRRSRRRLRRRQRPTAVAAEEVEQDDDDNNDDTVGADGTGAGAVRDTATSVPAAFVAPLTVPPVDGDPPSTHSNSSHHHRHHHDNDNDSGSWAAASSSLSSQSASPSLSLSWSSLASFDVLSDGEHDNDDRTDRTVVVGAPYDAAFPPPPSSADDDDDVATFVVDMTAASAARGLATGSPAASQDNSSGSSASWWLLFDDSDDPSDGSLPHHHP
jgi:hypothetical protein